MYRGVPRRLRGTHRLSLRIERCPGAVLGDRGVRSCPRVCGGTPEVVPGDRGMRGCARGCPRDGPAGHWGTLRLSRGVERCGDVRRLPRRLSRGLEGCRAVPWGRGEISALYRFCLDAS